MIIGADVAAINARARGRSQGAASYPLSRAESYRSLARQFRLITAGGAEDGEYESSAERHER